MDKDREGRALSELPLKSGRGKHHLSDEERSNLVQALKPLQHLADAEDHSMKTSAQPVQHRRSRP